MSAALPAPHAGEWIFRPGPVDETAAAMERKWGIDRLPRLVPPDLAARFQQAHDMRNGEWDYATEERRAALTAMMDRAWQALDKAATDAAQAPLPPGLWETPADPDSAAGGVLVLCQDDTHAQAVMLRAKAEGRLVTTWTLPEVARVLRANTLVNRIKDTWPGAKVTRAGRATRPMPDDDIPFGGVLEPVEGDEA